MNLRIEGQMLRFRIGVQELETLCAGGVLEQTTYLPGKRLLVIKVVPVSDSDSPLRLEATEDQLRVAVARPQAERLLASLPNREGIFCQQEAGNGQMLELVIEVDIRTQKRRRS